MFYCAQAALLTRGLAFSKHSAVIAAFGREFVSSGQISASHHAALRKAFDERIVGDYGVLEESSQDATEELLVAADSFIRDVEALVRRNS